MRRVRLEQLVHGKTVEYEGGPVPASDTGYRVIGRSPDYPTELAGSDVANPVSGIGLETPDYYDWSTDPWRTQGGGLAIVPVVAASESWTVTARLCGFRTDASAGRYYSVARYGVCRTVEWDFGIVTEMGRVLSAAPLVVGRTTLQALAVEPGGRDHPLDAEWLGTVEGILKGVLSGQAVGVMPRETMSVEEGLLRLATVLAAVPEPLRVRLPVAFGLDAIQPSTRFAVAFGRKPLTDVRVLWDSLKCEAGIDLAAGERYVGWLRKAAARAQHLGEVADIVDRAFASFVAPGKGAGWKEIAGQVVRALEELERLEGLREWLAAPGARPPALTFACLADEALREICDSIPGGGARLLEEILSDRWRSSWQSVGPALAKGHAAGAVARLLGLEGVAGAKDVEAARSLPLPATVESKVLGRIDELLAIESRSARRAEEWKSLAQEAAGDAEWVCRWRKRAWPCLFRRALRERVRGNESPGWPEEGLDAGATVDELLRGEWPPAENVKSLVMTILRDAVPSEATLILDELVRASCGARGVAGAYLLAEACRDRGVTTQAAKALLENRLQPGGGVCDGALIQILAQQAQPARAPLTDEMAIALAVGWAEVPPELRGSLQERIVERLGAVVATLLGIDLLKPKDPGVLARDTAAGAEALRRALAGDRDPRLREEVLERFLGALSQEGVASSIVEAVRDSLRGHSLPETPKGEVREALRALLPPAEVLAGRTVTGLKLWSSPERGRVRRALSVLTPEVPPASFRLEDDRDLAALIDDVLPEKAKSDLDQDGLRILLDAAYADMKGQTRWRDAARGRGWVHEPGWRLLFGGVTSLSPVEVGAARKSRPATALSLLLSGVALPPGIPAGVGPSECQAALDGPAGRDLRPLRELSLGVRAPAQVIPLAALWLLKAGNAEGASAKRVLEERQARRKGVFSRLLSFLASSSAPATTAVECAAGLLSKLDDRQATDLVYRILPPPLPRGTTPTGGASGVTKKKARP